MSGTLDGEEIIVADPAEGSQIYNKGYYGVPMKGGGLKLDLMEATYLVDSGRLEVRSKRRILTAGDLLRLAHKTSKGFEIRYLVYRELRQRGYIVKMGHPPLDFRVFPRGGAPNKNSSKWWVAAISERSAFDLGDLLDNIDRADHVRKKLLLAVVDEESDVTYYEVRRHSPKGRLAEVNIDSSHEGIVMADRVIVTDPDSAESLRHAHCFGK